MSNIEEAIEKLEKILDRHVCLPRREELNKGYMPSPGRAGSKAIGSQLENDILQL